MKELPTPNSIESGNMNFSQQKAMLEEACREVGDKIERDRYPPSDDEYVEGVRKITCHVGDAEIELNGFGKESHENPIMMIKDSGNTATALRDIQDIKAQETNVGKSDKEIAVETESTTAYVEESRK